MGLYSLVLAFCLHPLQADLNPHIMAQLHNEFYKGQIKMACLNIFYKYPVNFHNVCRNFLQDSKRGITCSKIIHSDFHTEAAYPVKDPFDPVYI